MNERMTAPPGRRPSITDVAVLAGVSKAAVSKVIRNAYGVSPVMRDRVDSAIDELGYRPRIAARSMRGQSFTIGFEIPQLGNDFFGQVIRGITRELAHSGYQLILATSIDGHAAPSVIDTLVDRQVDGIIAVSPDVTPHRLEQIARQIPVVILGRHDDAIHYDIVSNDDALGVRLVMDHLQSLGHRRIAHLTVEPSHFDAGSVVPHIARLNEYLSIMRASDCVPQVVYSSLAEPDAYRVSRELLSSEHPPTAIFGGNDTLAIGALRALADSGLDRDSVAIVGYDGIDIAKHPLISLTTVDQHGETMGSTAAALLLERMRDGRTTATHHQITPYLRIGASTKARMNEATQLTA